MACASALDQPQSHDTDAQAPSDLRLWRVEQSAETPLFQLSPSRGAVYLTHGLSSAETGWFAWLGKYPSEGDYRWAIRHGDHDTSISLAKMFTSSDESIEVQPLYLAKQYQCPTYRLSEEGRLHRQRGSDPNQALRVVHQDASYVHGINTQGDHVILSRHCLYVTRPWIHLVFDLDETLVWSECGNPKSSSKLDHGYGPDCMADGVVELLRWIGSLPQVRISFWSASEVTRVRSVLANIRVAPAQTALDMATVLLSAEDLTLIDPSGKRIVPAKDLRKIEPDISNVVLVDDKSNALPGQQNHWLNLADRAMSFSNAILDQPLDAESLNAVGKIAAEHPYRDNRAQQATLVRHLERRKSKPFAIAGLISSLLQQIETGLSLSEARAQIYQEHQEKLTESPYATGAYATDWVWDDELFTQGKQILRLFNPALALSDFSWLTEGVYKEDLETDRDYVTFRGLCLYQHPTTGRWSKRPCLD
jgi:hypothetical protein